MADSFTLAVSKDNLIAKASEIHIDPNATSGTLPESHGVQLSYSVVWSNRDQAGIEFTVVRKPRLIPVSAIQNRVKSLLGV